MGGHIGTEASASVLTYDAEAGTWATAPALPSPRAFCRATTIDGGILLLTRGRVLQHKDAAWSEIAEGGLVGSPACGSVLLG